MVRILAVAILLAGLAAPARADDAATAKALLETLETASSKDERLAAEKQLAEIGGRVIDTLSEFLRRDRTASVDTRRNILKQIKAAIPDKSGRFSNPGRSKKSKDKADDAFDWIGELIELKPQAGLGEVIADVAAIRALAASRTIEAGKLILAIGFADDTMIYRDEVGRRLRQMAPYSLPALIEGTKGKKNGALFKYVNYQLERLDRQDARKALDAAVDDEDLTIAILDAYGASEYREAVAVVFSRIDDEAPRIRAAARRAWTAYVTAPHPPPPKRRSMQLAGGKKTPPRPVELNSLQLARVQLDDRTEELFGEPLPPAPEVEEGEDEKEIDLLPPSERIFEHYDRLRAKRDAAIFEEGKAKADAGDLAGAIAIYDQLLAQDPARAERAVMSEAYLARADELEDAEQWAEAAAMFSKAHGLAPEGPNANDALAAQHYALGKALEADGKDGSAEFRKAVALRPDYAEAQEAAKAATPPPSTSDPRWLLYIAGGVAAAALLLLALGLTRRSARPA